MRDCNAVTKGCTQNGFRGEAYSGMRKTEDHLPVSLPITARWVWRRQSIMVGTGRGATLGVLIKNAEVQEIMEKVNAGDRQDRYVNLR